MILQQVKNKLLLTLITIVHLFNYLHLFFKKGQDQLTSTGHHGSNPSRKLINYLITGQGNLTS